MQNSSNQHDAVQLYEEYAEKGDMNAQYKLGLSYLTGDGSLQDFAEAVKWLNRAAENGYGLAQYKLGLIYHGGYGIVIDRERSYVWFNLAAATGMKEAVSMRDKAMRSLSPEQLAQAQKFSREWLASQPKTSPLIPYKPSLGGEKLALDLK